MGSGEQTPHFRQLPPGAPYLGDRSFAIDADALPGDYR
jgi:hypothetical protein